MYTVTTSNATNMPTRTTVPQGLCGPLHSVSSTYPQPLTADLLKVGQKLGRDSGVSNEMLRKRH